MSFMRFSFFLKDGIGFRSYTVAGLENLSAPGFLSVLTGGLLFFRDSTAFWLHLP
jgi:hypothetical protein